VELGGVLIGKALVGFGKAALRGVESIVRKPDRELVVDIPSYGVGRQSVFDRQLVSACYTLRPASILLIMCLIPLQAFHCICTIPLPLPCRHSLLCLDKERARPSLARHGIAISAALDDNDKRSSRGRQSRSTCDPELRLV
jgi:hypothetical protein